MTPRKSPAAIVPESEDTRAERDAIARVRAVIHKLPQRFEANVDLRTLEDWPRNPKDHDFGMIEQSMHTNGAFGVLYVQESSRRIMAGHGRKDVLLRNGVTHFDCIFIDCDDEVAENIVLIDNRANEAGGYKQDVLLDILKERASTGTLTGTGYDADDVDALLQLVEPSFAPTDNEPPRLDQLKGVPITCPECGHIFTPVAKDRGRE